MRIRTRFMRGFLWLPKARILSNVSTRTALKVLGKSRKPTRKGSLRCPTCSARRLLPRTQALMEDSPFLVELQRIAFLPWIMGSRDLPKSLLPKICMGWSGVFILSESPPSCLTVGSIGGCVDLEGQRWRISCLP
ncbi:uncharacterized protein [Typha latifolia]|uniref:uncharacterized protein isoform X2 n=1 Tax=Typha latifolia TaxID=4733 RepID=UPI003C2AF037